jgi:hypothetical protein
MVDFSMALPPAVTVQSGLLACGRHICCRRKRDFGTSQCKRVISVSATYKVHELTGRAAEEMRTSRIGLLDCRSAGAVAGNSCLRPKHERDDGNAHSHIGSAIVNAIARAFRWRDMLENGTYASIAEIAAAVVLRLTCAEAYSHFPARETCYFTPSIC